MNRFLIALICFSFLVVGCRTNRAIRSSNQHVTNVVISDSNLYRIVEVLASDSLKGRQTGTEGAEKAATFIETYFKKYDIQPYYDTFRDSFDIDNNVAYNIIGEIKGNDDSLKNQLIIVSAHYDHIGIIKALNGDSIANGANDNASGVSAVLDIANYFSKSKSNKRTLLFVLFSGEELGLEGSAHLARKLKAANANIYCVLNFDMIGTVLSKAPKQAQLTGSERSNMQSIINKYCADILLVTQDNESGFDLFRMSDNYPFYKICNVPSHTIVTFDFKNGYLHDVRDEIKYLNFENMGFIVENMKKAIENIANSEVDEIKLK